MVRTGWKMEMLKSGFRKGYEEGLERQRKKKEKKEKEQNEKI